MLRRHDMQLLTVKHSRPLNHAPGKVDPREVKRLRHANVRGVRVRRAGPVEDGLIVTSRSAATRRVSLLASSKNIGNIGSEFAALSVLPSISNLMATICNDLGSKVLKEDILESVATWLRCPNAERLYTPS